MTTIEPRVPFVDLSQQLHELKPEIDKKISQIFSCGEFVLGPSVAQFEESFAAYLGSKYCVTVHNGTIALQLALMALGIGKGDEVITAANSFIATAEAIAFAGAVPRLVDVGRENALIDVSLIEGLITKKTKAIIPVHLYGQSADMDVIMQIAHKHKLIVIEDACQAHGAKYKGKRVGTIGHVGCFSFYPSKNLGAAGDGGAIATDIPELAEQMKLLRNHGSRKKYHHEILGNNYRLDAIQCAVLSVKLPCLDKWNEERSKKASYYNQHLARIESIKPLSNTVDASNVFHLYVIQTDHRDAIANALLAANIGYGIHYPVPIHMQPAFHNLNYIEGAFPASEYFSKSILSLPMYPELSQQQQDLVIDVLQSVSPSLSKTNSSESQACQEY